MEALPPLANARDMIDEIENRSSYLLVALESGQLSPGGIITEGSAGNTAISIATVAPAFAFKSHIIIPNDAVIEKDYKGYPADRSKTGGWIPAALILVKSIAKDSDSFDEALKSVEATMTRLEKLLQELHVLAKLVTLFY
ncbi:hypothetical protein HN51_012264, partial [Arachis hypogaea]